MAAVPPLPEPVVSAKRLAWRDGVVAAGARIVAQECAVAVVCDGATEAVMMATPADLEDFAVGFCLTEGIVRAADDVRRIEIVPQADGIEARAWLAPGLGAARASRRRRITGPTGCGLCGVDSLAEAAGPAIPVADLDLRIGSQTLSDAMRRLADDQPLNRAARAVHAAGLWRTDTGLSLVREDVGRHNALDKLAGALARQGSNASGGVVLLTSRVSVEMVQKAAAMAAPMIVAVSAPTALAIRVADAARITLMAVAREDGFEIFTHPERVVF